MISFGSPRFALSLSLSITALGCVIDDIDLSDRRCPCVTGWVCDEAADRCVAALPMDGGDVLPSDANVEPDAPPPPPTCDTIPDAVFCDDFERGDLTRWVTATPAPGGSVAASPSAAHSGTHGLRLSAPATATITRLAATVDTRGADDLYFRAWVRVSARTAGRLEVFELSAGSEGSVAAQLLPLTESYRVRVAREGASSVADEGRSGRWSVGAWECVRGRVVRSDSSGRIEVFDSGPHQAILTGVDTDWGRPFDGFEISLEGSLGGSQIDLDDIVWTRTPLPCDEPG